MRQRLRPREREHANSDAENASEHERPHRSCASWRAQPNAQEKHTIGEYVGAEQHHETLDGDIRPDERGATHRERQSSRGERIATSCG